MKNILIIVVILLIVGGLFLYGTSDPVSELDDPVVSDTATYKTFSDTSTGLEFSYKTAPDGYVVDDLSAFIGEEDTSVLKVIRVINEKEKIELETSEGGREGPPTISVMVFQNDLKQTAGQWVDSTPRFSNIQLALGEVDRDAVVGGANAVTYRTDGLYLSDNVVVANGDYVFHFSGSFHEVDSGIHNEFKKLIASISFVPTTVTPAAKIDPSVACESALAYMTFESGDDADQFVTACINGEHPEVIERYIKDMGLDGAAI